MIKELKIKNFQSHKDTVIKFNKNVNIIIGSSDSGKSAVIRAIKWVLFNSPSGTQMCSRWGGVTEVELKLINGTVIGRKRSKSINEYSLNGYTYSGFGNSLPNPIKEATGEINELNLQEQLDTPFLLSKSSGEINRYLNNLVDLEIIDSSIKTCNSLISNNKKEIEFLEKEIVNTDKRLIRYKDMELLENKYKVMDKNYNEFIQLKEDYYLLNRKIDDYNLVQRKINILRRITDLEPQYKVLREKLNKATELYNKGVNLSNLIKQAKTALKTLKIKPVLNELVSKYNKITERIEEVKSNERTITYLRRLIREFEDTERSIKVFSDSILKYEKKYKELMPDECPLCGSNIGEE